MLLYNLYALVHHSKTLGVTDGARLAPLSWLPFMYQHLGAVLCWSDVRPAARCRLACLVHDWVMHFLQQNLYSYMANFVLQRLPCNWRRLQVARRVQHSVHCQP
jgi:hypothetical protein